MTGIDANERLLGNDTVAATTVVPPIVFSNGSYVDGPLARVFISPVNGWRPSVVCPACWRGLGPLALMKSDDPRLPIKAANSPMRREKRSTSPWRRGDWTCFGLSPACSARKPIGSSRLIAYLASAPRSYFGVEPLMNALSTASRCCFIVFPAAVVSPAAIA
jgi:hypothetical protein